MPNEEPNAGVLQDNHRGAVLSNCETYRYRLWREWDTEKPTLAWIMLNPSTADETEDDPTLRRCIGYAENWGYGGVEVGNVFALRATEPSELLRDAEPIGSKNDAHLRQIACEADRVIVAWGQSYNRGTGKARKTYTAGLLLDEVSDLWALGTTKEGCPVHPLYQPVDAGPQRWFP